MIRKGLLLGLIMAVFCVEFSFAQTYPTTKQVVVNNGIGLGSAIAVTISWSRNKSIFWAIIHGILSWLYVIYYYFTRNQE